MGLRVTQYGEPIVREKGVRVDRFDAKLEQLAADMIETVYDYEGIGLAAQQIGQAIQLCVVDTSDCRIRDDEKAALDKRSIPIEVLMPLVLVNPVIEFVGQDTAVHDEGCLSLPGITCPNIERVENIRVKYQDLQGVVHVLECDGILARCIQHEVDHINGILIVDKLPPHELTKVKPKLNKLKRESRDFLKETS